MQEQQSSFVPEVKQARVQILNPKYSLKQGGSFPFN